MMMFAMFGVSVLLGCAGYVAAISASQIDISLAFFVAFLATAGQIVTAFMAGLCVDPPRN